MAATGVSAILLQFTQALFVLKIVGGAYLLFLALKAGRSALTPDEQIEKALAAAPTVSGFGLYRRGLLMHLTNPKALLGWIATMTLGLGPQATPETVVIILAGWLCRVEHYYFLRLCDRFLHGTDDSGVSQGARMD